MKEKKCCINRKPIIFERVRRIGTEGFSFIPHRFLRDGFFASLEPNELLLYFFLVLAADRHGISFYHYERICDLLRMSPELYLQVRKKLIERDLLAFDGHRYQLLELPKQPVILDTGPLRTEEDFEEWDSATIRQRIHKSLNLR